MENEDNLASTTQVSTKISGLLHNGYASNDVLINKKKPTIAYNVVSPNKVELLYNNLPISAGLTIANSLRRCIIAFSSGYAVTFIRISGADHAFAPVNGAAEDYINIILNIRGLIVKHDPIPQVNEWFKIKVQGPNEIIGEHFNIPGKVEILNKDHKICSISNFNNFELEFMITQGSGFTTSQEHKERIEAYPFHYGSYDFEKAVVLDTNYSSVKSVTYNVSEPFNRSEDMSLLVETNGSVTAEKVMNNAIEILIPLYSAINPNLQLNDNNEISMSNSLESKQNEILSLRIDDPSLGLSKRSINGLIKQSIYTLADLAKHDENDIINFQNIGKNSANEIKAIMKSRGVNFAVSSSN